MGKSANLVSQICEKRRLKWVCINWLQHHKLGRLVFSWKMEVIVVSLDEAGTLWTTVKQLKAERSEQKIH